MREEALVMGAELAGLLYLCYGEDQRAVSSLMSLTHDQGIKFRAAVDKAIKGKFPFRAQEQNLRNELKKLKG